MNAIVALLAKLAVKLRSSLFMKCKRNAIETSSSRALPPSALGQRFLTIEGHVS
ncbi:hypothetical protein ACMHYB_30915 [Sorangium sp. So ce1128]